ncbi:hypothetical protein ACOMHN_044859 [Nucella lapillus]
MAPRYGKSCGPWFLVALLYVIATAQATTPARATVQKTEVPAQNVTLGYLQRTLGALRDAMDFFRRQYDKINLDAVIGTRIVEGSLKVLLSNLQRKQGTNLLPAAIVANIRDIYDVAKRTSDDAMPHVDKSQPLYYQRIGPAIQEGLWELNYTRRQLPGSAVLWSYSPEEAMSEAESDDCLTELFGTSGKTREKCVISDKCWRRMITLGYSRYSLSHQIFYLQIAEQSGCLPEVLWRIVQHEQWSLRHLQDTFCANMLREALAIARADYPGPQQDLFMEQAALCGLYGYWEFFRAPWLDVTLGWQDRVQGCYSWAGWPTLRIGEGRRQHHVTKREERRLDNGCLCHRTTVAAGSLVQYVRYLVEEYVAEVSSDKSKTN